MARWLQGAATTIQPLLVRRDPEAVRANAFILALAGDLEGARRTIDTFMPGAGLRFEPFFRSLPNLQPAQKAAAVHLGIFPNAAAQRYAGPVQAPPVATSNIPAQRQETFGRQPAESVTVKTVNISEAPRRPVQETAKSTTGQITAGPPLDTSRYASTRSSRDLTADSRTAEAADKDPEPRSVGGLDDIAKMLSEAPADLPVGEPMTKVAEAQLPEAAAAINPPLASKPKAETANPKVSRPKVERTQSTAAADKKKAARLAAEKKANAGAEKARAETTRLGVAGTNWVQLAGGSNADRMATEYRKLAAKAGSLLKARSGYVTQGKDYFRLLVGPFPTTDEAQEFVRKLDKAGVDSFRWTRNPAQIRIEKLKT